MATFCAKIPDFPNFLMTQSNDFPDGLITGTIQAVEWPHGQIQKLDRLVEQLGRALSIDPAGSAVFDAPPIACKISLVVGLLFYHANILVHQYTPTDATPIIRNKHCICNAYFL